MPDMVFTLSGFDWPQLNSEFRLDFQTLNNYELHIVKEVAGVVAGELNSSMQRGDQEVTLALVAIAVLRANLFSLNDLIRKPDGLIWQAKPGQIVLTIDTDEVDAGPPEPQPTSEGLSGDGSDAKTSSTSSSDPGSEQTPDSSGQSSTGPPRLVTGSDSDPETLVA